MVLQAGYGNVTGSSWRKVVKATILVKKKPELSEEAFVEYYNQKHAQLAAPLLMKHNVISFGVAYCLRKDRNIVGDMFRGATNIPDYDAVCTFVFKDYKDLAKFMFDPEKSILIQDRKNFMVEEEMKMIVGDEYMIIENGDKVD